MPSFDLVSEVDQGELKNAVDQAQREVGNRYDFKGSDTQIELNDNTVQIEAANEYQIKASVDILRTKMAKRGIGAKSLSMNEMKSSGNQRYKITGEFKMGIDKETGKKINKLIKETKLKVTSSYLDEKIRVTGKKIDDLQSVFQMLRSHDSIELELQMQNMKS